MKRNFDDLNLRAAFRDEPESCHRALMNAVRSLKEEEKDMKHLNFRPLLIAVIVIVSMLSVAFAASEIFGFTNYYERWGITLSPSTLNAMQPTEHTTYKVGPLTFTLQERIADPYNAYISTRIEMTDGSQPLMCLDPEAGLSDAKRVALNLEMVERDYGAGPIYTQPTYLEAAQKTGLPLYSVRARLEVAEDLNGGEGMENILYNNSGCVYINQQTLKSVDAGSELSCQLFLRVSQIDPTTGEEVEKWSTRESYSMPVSAVLTTGSYLPETPKVDSDMTLARIDADLYATGVYIHRRYQLPADMPFDEDYPVWNVVDATRPTNADGHPFTRGISLSGWCDTGSWPAVTVTEMLNLSELPPIIQVGGVNYTLQME